VFALTRSASSHAKLQALGALPVDANLESNALLPLPAVDAVVHAAALFRFSGLREPFFRTNVDGTVKLLAAAEKAGATTFVHISAAGVIEVWQAPQQPADDVVIEALVGQPFHWPLRASSRSRRPLGDHSGWEVSSPSSSRARVWRYSASSHLDLTIL